MQKEAAQKIDAGLRAALRVPALPPEFATAAPCMPL
jgi:hypothetical protein